MADIVERLRIESEYRSDMWGLLGPEAADEIERLRDNVKYRDDIIGLSPNGDRHADLVAEIERLRAEVDESALLLRRALRRMKQYEMDVDDSPPRDHRQFMEQATDYLSCKGLTGSILREGGADGA